MLRRARSRATPLLIGVGLLVLLAVLSATGESAVEVGQGWMPGFGEPEGRPGGDEGPPADEFEAPPLLRVAAAIGMVAVLLVFAILVLIGFVAIVLGARFERRRRRPRSQSSVPSSDTEDGAGFDVEVMRRAAVGALGRLEARTGGAPDDAVIMAWLALEEAAAESGCARLPHQTPTEFTAAVLAGMAVDAGALDRLRGLYQRARFGVRHGLTEDDVRAALDAVRRVVADLETGATAGAAGSTA